MRAAPNRHARRKSGVRVPFCRVIYYCHSMYDGRVIRKNRNFPDYESAIAQLTIDKLQLEDMAWGFRGWTPWKIQHGYRQGGKKCVTNTTLIAPKPEPKEPRNVGTSMGWDNIVLGQYGQQWQSSLSNSQTYTPWYYDTANYRWSSGTATTSSTTSTVGSGLYGPSIVSLINWSTASGCV